MAYANSEQVAVAWLKGVDGVPASGVATTLPTDNTTWATSGFVVVSVVGGSRHGYFALKTPVVRCDCWAVTLDANGNPTGKPPWGKASQLSESVYAATLDEANVRRTLSLPGVLPDCRVIEAEVISEPQRLYGDETNRTARLFFDLMINWIELT